MKIFNFNTELLKSPDMDATYIEFPFDVFESFGKKGQVKVVAEINGYTFRSSLAKMGHHCHFLGINKNHRKNMGINPGDKLNVIIREDTEVREVEIPEDFKEILSEFPDLNDFFNNMSYTHRKEYVEWINSAKMQDTRLRRLDKAILMLEKSYAEKALKNRTKR